MRPRLTKFAVVCTLLALSGFSTSSGHPLVLAQQGPSTSHLREGLTLLQSQHYAEAAAAFDEVLQRDPEDGMAWYYFGLSHHSMGSLDQAIRAHLMATQLVGTGNPLKVNATYNVACAYALMKNPEKALKWLHRARNAGFNNQSLLRTDSDLESLREDPRFEALAGGGALAAPAEGSASVTSVTGVLAGGTGGIALGADGKLYVAAFDSKVWRIGLDGQSEVFSTGFTKSADCTFDAKGHLIQADFGASKVWSIAPDGTRTEIAIPGLSGPVGVDTAEDGSLYVTNFNKNEILRVAPDGTTSVLASGGGMNGPNGIANAGEMGLFVVNYKDGGVLHLDPASGELRFLCELPGGGNGHAVWTGEDLLVTARAGHQVFRVAPDGKNSVVAGSGQKATVDGGAATSAFSLPNGIALSGDGKRVYVNDRLPGNTSIVRSIELK